VKDTQLRDFFQSFALLLRLLTYFTSFTFFLQLSHAEYAQVNMVLPSGWEETVPKKQLKWQRLPTNNKPFELQLKNGLVSNADKG
jgi:hypothetical protein